MTTWGLVLVAGAVLAFVGASVGFGGGVAVGLAMLPVALLLMAIGTLGIALATPGFPGVLVMLAGSVAVCALGLAIVGTLSALAIEPVSAAAEGLLRPMFAALVVAVVAFSVVGAILGGLPAVPAIAVAIGAGLLGVGGLIDQERMADIGFWTSTAGWIGLGVISWGSA